MRIVMIAHSNAPWTPYFARYFRDRGDAIRVVSFAPHKLDGVEGIDVEFVGREPFDFHKNKHLYLTRVPRIRGIIGAFKPDLVFAPYLFSNGLAAALSWRGPLVVAAVGSDVQNVKPLSGARRLFRESIIRFVSSRADIINTVSPALSDELMRLGVPASKLLLLPFGIDLGVFHAAADMPRLEGINFISTRKHEPVYDIPTIIDALARLKTGGRTFRCTFTCGGTFLEEYKARAAAAGLGDSVTFTGNLPHGELPKLLRDADIYISASLSDGTSLSLLEGLASGLLPVVTRIAANIPWVKPGETGLLFEPGRPESLAQALAQAMDDAALRQRAFQLNRELVDHSANMQRNMDCLAGAFAALVSGRNRTTQHTTLH